nr:hypothetical protein [Marseillevirus cajuinensis]
MGSSFFRCSINLLSITFDGKRLSNKRMNEKTSWYRGYFKRNHEGENIDDYVSSVVLACLTCRHREKLSSDKRVHEIFMAMMSDCLPLSRRFIASWLKENGVEFPCECGEKAFAVFE